MAIGRSTWKPKSKFIFCFCLLNFLFSCVNKDGEQKVGNGKKMPDTGFIQNGDVIYRYGNGFFSKHFRNFSRKEKIYSHAGVINIGNDSVFVIHSEADEFTGIGGVKRDGLNMFLNDASVWAVYRLKYPGPVRNKVADIALIYVRRNTPFDLKFDYTDDTSVYCTELVALCLNKAVGRTIVKPGSQLKEQLFYSVDDTYLIDEMELIYKSEQ